MLVKELIAKLQEMDPEKTVLYDDDEYGPAYITGVNEHSCLHGKWPHIDEQTEKCIWLAADQFFKFKDNR